MATPARRAEAAAVSATFHVAMVKLGAEAMSEVIEGWQAVVPTSTRAHVTATAWATKALLSIRQRRHQVQAIVIPFMRLFRALQTGYTFQPIFDPEPETVSLSKLRYDFIQAVEAYAPDALTDSLIEDPDPYDDLDEATEVGNPDGSAYEPYDVDEYLDDDEDVITEEIERLSELLDEEERRAEAEAEEVLQALGVELLEEKLEQLADEELSAREADERQEEEHGKVGRRVAGHAERLVQNGGRHTRLQVAKADARVIAYVRVHYPEKDPQPCGFCALLLSRGISFRPYRTRSSAGKRSTEDNATWVKWATSTSWSDPLEPEDLEKYHPKCHCTVEEVYSEEQFDTDSRFDLNRELRRLYDEQFEDMTQWRRLMRERASQELADERKAA